MGPTGRNSVLLAALAAAGALLQLPHAGAQDATSGAPKAAPAGGSAYPPRPPAPAEVLARGKALYEAECAFCHGEDARGGDMGSNILRSRHVLNDQNGERLLPVLRGEGLEGSMMPRFNFTAQQAAELAAYLHSFRVNGYDGSRMRPQTILVGDAAAGQAYFERRCAGCHSATGDLRGIASRIPDPRTLQQRWLNPGGGGRGLPVRPATVSVTLPSGQRIQGRLVRIDDFLVTLLLDDGRQRTIRRNGDVPRVEIHDPYQPHKDLWPVYTDADIHNVTAYLATLQ
jgi:mono/diheme cytochrome c family protein